MELPFVSTKLEFEIEFKEALGFVDVDMPLRKIRPDLKVSANYLIKIIGRPTYDELIKNYKRNVEGATGAEEPYKDVELNEAFQYAIAVKAYSLYAPSNDLAHTSNGRRMRSSEEEKTPFEWMIANSDDVLQKRSYKALDALIDYMDQNYQFWKSSEQFKVTHNLFVRTLEDFSSAFVLDSRLLLIKLVPGLLQAERREILPRITQTVYQALKAKVIYFASGSEATPVPEAYTEDEFLLVAYIKEACAYYSLYWGFPRLQVNMFPEGLLQSIRSDRSTIKGRVVPVTPVIDQASKLFKEDCDRALLNIEAQMLKMYPPVVVEITEEETNQSKYGFDDEDVFVST
jgi:hypothetical protein